MLNSQANPERPTFLSLHATAALHILPEETLRMLRDQKRLPGFYSGRKFLVNLPLLEIWINDPDSPINSAERR